MFNLQRKWKALHKSLWTRLWRLVRCACSSPQWASVLPEVVYTAEYWSGTMWLNVSPCGLGSLIVCIRLHRLAGAGRLDLHSNVVNQMSAAQKPSHLAFNPNWYAFEFLLPVICALIGCPWVQSWVCNSSYAVFCKCCWSVKWLWEFDIALKQYSQQLI